MPVPSFLRKNDEYAAGPTWSPPAPTPSPNENYYGQVQEHLAAMPERPKAPMWKRVLAPVVQTAFPSIKDFANAPYNRRLSDWERRLKQLTGAAELGATERAEARKTKESEALIGAREASAAASGAYRKKLERPEAPYVPRTFKELLNGIVMDITKVPGIAKEEATKLIKGEFSDEGRESTYEQKFAQHVREIQLANPGMGMDEAQKKAAEEVVKERELETKRKETGIESTRQLTKQRKQMTQYREKLNAGSMKPSDARSLLGLLQSETRTRSGNPLDPLYGQSYGAALRAISSEHGIDVDAVYEVLISDTDVKKKPDEGWKETGPGEKTKHVGSARIQTPDEPGVAAALAAPAAPAVARRKVATREDVQRYAEEEGIPYEVAKELAAAEGYEVIE